MEADPGCCPWLGGFQRSGAERGQTETGLFFFLFGISFRPLQSMPLPPRSSSSLWPPLGGCHFSGYRVGFQLYATLQQPQHSPGGGAVTGSDGQHLVLTLTHHRSQGHSWGRRRGKPWGGGRAATTAAVATALAHEEKRQPSWGKKGTGCPGRVQRISSRSPRPPAKPGAPSCLRCLGTRGPRTWGSYLDHPYVLRTAGQKKASGMGSGSGAARGGGREKGLCIDAGR